MLYLVAGEASGDLHGGSLLKHLKIHWPETVFKGIGGPEMVKEGLLPLLPFEDFQVMGFTDVLKTLPLLRRHFYYLSHEILKDNPKAVIFIDYPGFNLRLATYLRKKRYQGKLIHYIAPTVWAWKKNRVHSMKASLDLLLTIFPFEPPYFPGLNVKYVGNPLLNELPDPSFNEKRPLLALFPGSRRSEIARNLPLQLQAAELFQKKHPEFSLAISLCDEAMRPLIQKFTDAELIPHAERYPLMQQASLALAKSGTVTLELALLGCPTVVQYRLTRLNYFLARYVFRINLPHFSLPNLLLNERIFPEYYHVNIEPKQLAISLEEQLNKKNEIQEKAALLKKLLTNENASQNAALEIVKIC